MARHRRTRSRRFALVAGGVLSLSTAATTMLGGLAYADEGGLVDGTPCTTAARACVDLNGQKAWLIQDGKIVRGPVPIASGGGGKETPAGDSFHVYRKDQDHKSKEFPMKNGQPAPMPYSVFFEDGGIAFHGGSPQRASAGCVHLNLADAIAFFNNLQVGDLVQVKSKPGSGPIAATPGAAQPSVDTGAAKETAAEAAKKDDSDGDDSDDGDDDDGDDDGDDDDGGDDGDDGGEDS